MYIKNFKLFDSVDINNDIYIEDIISLLNDNQDKFIFSIENDHVYDNILCKNIIVSTKDKYNNNSYASILYNIDEMIRKSSLKKYCKTMYISSFLKIPRTSSSIISVRYTLYDYKNDNTYDELIYNKFKKDILGLIRTYFDHNYNTRNVNIFMDKNRLDSGDYSDSYKLLVNKFYEILDYKGTNTSLYLKYSKNYTYVDSDSEYVINITSLKYRDDYFVRSNRNLTMNLRVYLIDYLIEQLKKYFIKNSMLGINDKILIYKKTDSSIGIKLKK